MYFDQQTVALRNFGSPKSSFGAFYHLFLSCLCFWVSVKGLCKREGVTNLQIWGFQFLDGPLYSWNFCKEHLGTWTNKTGKLRDHLARVKHVEAKYVHSS